MVSSQAQHHKHEVVRVDRITCDEFPAMTEDTLSRAMNIADEETRVRAPHGDVFLVKQGDNIVYYPEA